MITRRFQKGDAASRAEYSACGRYRYGLARQWNPDGPRLLCLLLNPSTATEAANDPTVERCERRARADDFGAVEICNLFAWRATDPAALRAAHDPVGPENDSAIFAAAARADTILCGWGAHGSLCGRGTAVAARLRAEGRALWHLGLTLEGAPRHPLYIAYATKPQLWETA